MKVLFQLNNKCIEKDNFGVIHALKESCGLSFVQANAVTHKIANKEIDSFVIEQNATANDFDRIHRIFSEYSVQSFISLER